MIFIVDTKVVCVLTIMLRCCIYQDPLRDLHNVFARHLFAHLLLVSCLVELCSHIEWHGSCYDGL